jgi:hypothetical protein
MAGERERELGRVLEEHREALFGVPGVVGTGVGARAGEGGPVIHVYVAGAGDVQRAGTAVRRILAGHEVEVLVAGVPEAQGG